MQVDRTIAAPGAVRKRLAQLGLSVEIVADVVLAGHIERLGCTENDAPTMGGLRAWGMAVRRFREHLRPSGWTKSDLNNLPRIISPSGRTEIVVMTGDEATGSTRFGTPRPRYPKGYALRGLIAENRWQLDLFGPAPDPVTVDGSAGHFTWILLMSFDGRRTASELSLPTEIDEHGYVRTWSERVLLPDVGVATLEEDRPDEEDGDAGIDVPVRPRT